MRTMQVPLSPLEWVGPKTKASLLKLAQDFSPVSAGEGGGAAFSIGAGAAAQQNSTGNGAVTPHANGNSPKRKKEPKRRYTTNHMYRPAPVGGKGDDTTLEDGSQLRAVISEPALRGRRERPSGLQGTGPARRTGSWSQSKSKWTESDSDADAADNNFIPNQPKFIRIRYPALISQRQDALQKQRSASRELIPLLKSCLKSYTLPNPPDSFTQTSSAVGPIDWRGGSPATVLDYHSQTVRNTREAALLQSASPDEAPLSIGRKAGMAMSVAAPVAVRPNSASSSSPPLMNGIAPPASREGTGPRVVAPRAVMKALSFSNPDEDPSSETPGVRPADGTDTATSTPKASTTPISPAAPQITVEGPPVVAPAEEVQLMMVKSRDEPILLPDRTSAVSPPPSSVASSTKSSQRQGLISRGSSKLIAKFTGFRGNPEQSDLAQQKDSDAECSSLVDGGLIALVETCSCRNCVSKMALAARSGE